MARHVNLIIDMYSYFSALLNKIEASRITLRLTSCEKVTLARSASSGEMRCSAPEGPPKTLPSLDSRYRIPSSCGAVGEASPELSRHGIESPARRRVSRFVRHRFVRCNRRRVAGDNESPHVIQASSKFKLHPMHEESS